MAMYKPPFISISLFLLLLALYAFPINGSMRLTARISSNDQSATQPGHNPGIGHSINSYAADKINNSQRRRQLMEAGTAAKTTYEDYCLCTTDKMLSKIEDEVIHLLKDKGFKAREWKE